MIRRKNIFRLATGLFILSLFLLLGSIKLQGYSIIEGGLDNSSYFSFGIILFISSIFLFVTGIEKKVSVYTSVEEKQRAKREEHHITDPELYFNSGGHLTLEQLKTEVDVMRRTPGLVEIVQQDYGPQLIGQLEGATAEKKSLLEKFLKVLYSDYKSSKQKTERKELKPGEIDRIYNSFKGGWSGFPDKKQADILREYDLDFRSGSKHGRIYSIKNPEIFVETSSTPGDVNAGRNIGKDVIKILKRQYLK